MKLTKGYTHLKGIIRVWVTGFTSSQT